MKNIELLSDRVSVDRRIAIYVLELICALLSVSEIPLIKKCMMLIKIILQSIVPSMILVVLTIYIYL